MITRWFRARRDYERHNERCQEFLTHDVMPNVRLALHYLAVGRTEDARSCLDMVDYRWQLRSRWL